jgi:hypothetical protein
VLSDHSTSCQANASRTNTYNVLPECINATILRQNTAVATVVAKVKQITEED